MTFNDLNKQQKMLVYMLKNGATSKYIPIEIRKYSKEAISFGVTTSLNSMRSMLSTLKKKKKHLVVSRGDGCWYLSKYGHVVARQLAASVNLLGPYDIEDVLVQL